MPDHSPALPRRRSRFGLFAPFVLLALVFAGWATAWLSIRDQTSRALDDWIAAEAALGRLWICPNRMVGGFPFRIEVTCDSLALQRPDLRVSLGRVAVITRIYAPRHLIAHVAGPLRAGDGPIAVEGTWRALEASLRTAKEGLQRASLVVDGPQVRLAGAAAGDLTLSGQRLETHLRPNPTRGAGEGAFDWSFQAAQMALPLLDDLIGGIEPADLDLQVTVTQAGDVAARPLAEELERWRQAGGRLEVTAVTLAKGGRRLEGKGQLWLDDAHRPQGRADLAAAGIEGLLGTFLSARTGATAALLGALTGRRAAPDPPPTADAQGGKPGLKPLPPLRIEGGRLLVGPIAVPGIRIAPLY